MKRIAKLDESVVHRIAAGEVIQRPCNAIKEMLENSVDAGATSIQITVQDGGLKQIQIQDNGHGILKEDLALLCERFATSKLTTFEDLYEMKTFGFRGEALASISHVARVSVISKTKDSSCAYKAEYLNGVMLAEPSPIAGNQGTTITVSDLFYNLPSRLKGIRSGSEEYAQIVKVIQRYAIELAGRVGISVRKAGIGSNADVQTSVSLAPSPMDVIKAVFTGELIKGLTTMRETQEESFKVTLSGCLSLPTFHQKTLVFILFINGRLVESPSIKKTLLAFYSQILPKGANPFAYLSLKMPPQSIDVNVHPTKSEVFFLHEAEVLQFIERSVRAAVQSDAMVMESGPTAKTESQPTQSQQTQASFVKDDSSQTLSIASVLIPTASSQPRKLYPFQMVHSDPKVRTLDSFITRAPQKKMKLEDGMGTSSESVSMNPIVIDARDSGNKKEKGFDEEMTPARQAVIRCGKPSKPTASEPRPEGSEDPRELSSVKTLIDDLLSHRHERLTEMIKSSVIVGIFSPERMLIQYQSKLLMIEHMRFAVEMLYQKCLLGFGYHECWQLEGENDLRQLLQDHVEAYYSEHLGEVNRMVGVIEGQTEMLLEYFSIQIVEGRLKALPRLLEGHVSPPPSLLAEFLYRLAIETEWDEEHACFQSISVLLSRTFASFVQQHPRQEEFLRHFLYPALKGGDLGKFGHIVGYNQELVKSGAITELTNTHELYKIFERC